jgi:hypothetical protein
MAISEAARSDLYTGLRDVLGPDRAETLMSAIPLHDLDEVATKGDIAVLRAEMTEMRAEFKADMAELQRTIIGWMVSLFVATVAALIGVALLS